MRVFSDRLVDSLEKKLFYDSIKVSDYSNDIRELPSSEVLFSLKI
jgi:hypothetical protein